MLLIYDADPYLPLVKDLVTPRSTIAEYVYYFLYREYNLNTLITTIKPHHLTRYGRVAKILKVQLKDLSLDQLKLGYERTIVRVVGSASSNTADIHIILGEHDYGGKVTDNRRMGRGGITQASFDLWFQ
jgi:hypothetical protein